MQLNLLEFSDFTKLLGKKLGMPEDMMSGGGMMMAPGMMAAPAGGAPAAGGAEVAPAAAEEKTSFTLKLDGFDAASKIKVIKEVRAITELGLKEAKELVEGAPCVVKPGITKEEAEELKKKLEDGMLLTVPMATAPLNPLRTPTCDSLLIVSANHPLLSLSHPCPPLPPFLTVGGKVSLE